MKKSKNSSEKNSLRKKISKVVKRDKISDAKVSEALKTVPNITNETVSEHREDILGSARKFIYPLQHSKHKFVTRSLIIFLIVIVSFFIYCFVELYELQSTSGFLYSITEVIPFPVAKEGNRWISYNSYLFELRRNMHYYVTQQQSNFSTKDGKTQLYVLRKQAMNRVVNDSYISELARQNHISVSNSDVNQAIAMVRTQNRLGNSKQVFNNVLAEYWGWNENDFKRELKLELLQQKVSYTLDKQAYAKAQTILTQLNSGGNFAQLAQQYSEDTSTAASGGVYPFDITLNSTNVPPQIIDKLFKLKPNQVSEIVNTGSTIEILQLQSVNGSSVKAAHIQINLKPIDFYIASLRAKQPPKIFINVSLK